MPMYYIRFLRDVEVDGHQFCALQRVVPVADCNDVEDAVRIAQDRFARLERVCDWRLRADFVETCIAERTPLGGMAA